MKYEKTDSNSFDFNHDNGHDMHCFCRGDYGGRRNPKREEVTISASIAPTYTVTIPKDIQWSLTKHPLRLALLFWIRLRSIRAA